jgi:hypothetical protein
VVPPPATAKAAPPEPAAPQPRASSSLDRNVQEAVKAAKREGWQHKKTVEIPGRHAAIILYDPTPETAPATKAMRADAVGAQGAPHTVKSGIVDVVETPQKSVLWDLTGDGPHFVVLHLTRCEPSCGTAQPVVLDLSAKDEFHLAAQAPECPTCIQDADRDGIPEFAYRMIELKIAPCSRVSCGPETALLVQVRGLESWDGSRFARNLRAFKPLYEARLKAARAEVKRVRNVLKKTRVCPLSAIRVASELFAYGRMTGVPELAAFKEADKVMAGYTTAQCNAEYDLLASPRTWIDLRSELVSEKLPILDGERKR